MNWTRRTFIGRGLAGLLAAVAAPRAAGPAFAGTPQPPGTPPPAGAAGATGRGEEVIKTCGSFAVVEAMRRGASPEEACREAQRRIVHWTKEDPDFDVKYVALRRDGEVACVGMKGREANPPEAALQTAAGFRVIAGSYLYESR